MKLDEIEMPARPGSSTSVLVATTAAASHAAPHVAAPAPRPPTLSAPAKPLNFSNCKNKNRRNYTKNMCLSTSFPMTANPWNGTLQLWAGATCPGLLGTHPDQPPRPQAFQAKTPSSGSVLGLQGGYTPVPTLHSSSSYE
jgi:hypothetical protein